MTEPQRLKYIAHRGNLEGPCPSQENRPEYLQAAIQQGFYVEADVWLLEGDLFLGHDDAQYTTSLDFLKSMGDRLFCHCKNIPALAYLRDVAPELECFYHENDPCVLTSKGNIWTFPGQQLTPRSICVMPERCMPERCMSERCSLENPNYHAYTKSAGVGICTDYPILYKGGDSR